jgi:uncharacterized protein (TIGR02421 family)
LPSIAPAPADVPLVRHLGIVIRPVYRDEETGQSFPLIRRKLHRGLSRAIKKAVLEFTRLHTTQRPPHYHSLGRRSMVKAVWEVDRRLAAISDTFDLLLLLTPTNAGAAWRRFERDRFEREPKFTYRPLPIDPALSKRALYRIPVEKVEDPTLELLFRDQQSELDRKISMLGERGSSVFPFLSLQMYGGIEPPLLDLAEEVVRRIPARSREISRNGFLSAEAFAERAAREIEGYRQAHPDVASTVEIRDDVAGLMVSRGKLLVGRGTKIAKARVDAALSHEIGTHILTYYNGRAQPFRQLYVGLPGYDELQEGLAVLSEYLVGGLSRPRLRLLAGRVLAVHRMTKGASFVEIFRELTRTYAFAQQAAFTMTMRVCRSGGFGKDAVYLRGLVKLLRHLGEGRNLETLLAGKMALDHIPMLRELQWRGVLKPPPLRPNYLNDPNAIQRLHRLSEGRTVLDLIKGRMK